MPPFTAHLISFAQKCYILSTCDQLFLFHLDSSNAKWECFCKGLNPSVSSAGGPLTVAFPLEPWQPLHLASMYSKSCCMRLAICQAAPFSVGGCLYWRINTFHADRSWWSFSKEHRTVDWGSNYWHSIVLFLPGQFLTLSRWSKVWHSFFLCLQLVHWNKYNSIYPVQFP